MVESTVENPRSAFRNLEDSAIIKCIGNTPLLEIKLFESEFPEVEVYAKAEWFNPGGLGEGQAGALHGEGRPGIGRIAAGQGSSRFHEREHRHRLRHDRSGAGDSRPPRPACECE